MTENYRGNINVAGRQKMPYWDDTSCLEYLRRHCTVPAEDFRDHLLEACRKLNQNG